MPLTFEPAGKPHLEFDSFPDSDNIKIISHCPHCKHHIPITLLTSNFRDWLIGGHLIQDVWPNMPANVRKRLVTGCCESCWDKIMTDIAYSGYSNYYDSTEEYCND